MNKRIFNLPLLLLSMAFLPGCDLIEDIFQAGVWFAIIAILIIAALIYLLLFKIHERRKREQITAEPEPVRADSQK